MACYYPQRAQILAGKVTFVGDSSFSNLTLPCGQCIGCRLDRSRDWAIRCVHEAQLHEQNSFLTLTYDDCHLPDDHSLNYSDFQLFFKRLRKAVAPTRIRFYMCGEYGDELGRPHFHAAVFGWEPADKKLWTIRDGNRLYSSPMLEKVWGKGFVTVGEVTYQSAAYIARYVTKKITGKNADEHYERIHPDTGEVIWIKPEFTNMSRRPGIGHDWYKRFAGDVFPSDEVILNGKPVKPPRYYTDMYAFREEVKNERIKEKQKHKKDNTRARLKVKEKVKLAQAKQLKRTLK